MLVISGKSVVCHEIPVEVTFITMMEVTGPSEIRVMMVVEVEGT